MPRNSSKLERQQSGNAWPHIEKLSFTIPEVAQVSGLGRTSIYDAIKTGALKSVRVCGRRLVLRPDLEAFLSAGREAAEAPPSPDDDEERPKK